MKITHVSAKIAVSGILFAILFMLFAACSNVQSTSTNTDNNSPSAPGTTNTANVPSASTATNTTNAANDQNASSPDNNSQTLWFQVNANMPLLKCLVSLSGDGNKHATKIVLSDASSGSLLETLTPPACGNVKTKSPVYFSDITFDGNLDILIPYNNPAHGISFSAFIWNSDTNRFDLNTDLIDLYNPVIDTENQQILARDTSSGYTSYVIYKYVNNQFVCTNSLGWFPASLEIDSIPNAGNYVHLSEMQGSQTVLDVYAPSDDGYNPDITDAQIAPYFVPGSFWDLSSSKWQCPFAEEIAN